MIVLGIDPGLQVCGYAVVKADGSGLPVAGGGRDPDGSAD